MKYLLSIILVIALCSTGFATTALVRSSSGQVLEISESDSSFSDFVNDFRVLVTGATYPDGLVFMDSDGEYTLGYAKILDGTVIRNATQNEIDTFQPARVDDYNQGLANRTIAHLNKDPKMRRIIIALIKGIIREDNENRSWIRDFKDAVAASTSLADFQSRVAALDTPVDREFQDAKDYIISQVSKDD